MKVKKMFRFSGFSYHQAIKAMDDNYYIFSCPARHITEKDLYPVPGYQEKGKRAEEAPDYMYWMYGLEKEGNYA